MLVSAGSCHSSFKLPGTSDRRLSETKLNKTVGMHSFYMCMRVMDFFLSEDYLNMNSLGIAKWKLPDIKSVFWLPIQAFAPTISS